MQSKKCEGVLPLAPFRKVNTIDEKIKLRDDGIELSVMIFLKLNIIV